MQQVGVGAQALQAGAGAQQVFVEPQHFFTFGAQQLVGAQQRVFFTLQHFGALQQVGAGAQTGAGAGAQQAAGAEQPQQPFFMKNA